MVVARRAGSNFEHLRSELAAERQLTAPVHVGHARWVRVCHWLLAASVLTLAFSGYVVLMSHPRLYWGKAGNDLTAALLELPISRNFHHGGWVDRITFFAGPGSPISAGRTYDIFNDNGWGRSLHFLAAWFLGVVGTVYVLVGLFSGHIVRDLLPRARELTAAQWVRDLSTHLRFHIQPSTGGPPYGLLQKVSYLAVLFVALPLMIITGLAMSPAVTAAYPIIAEVFGGSQSARTIHFFVFASLVIFVLVHVLMVVLSGLRRQMRTMTLGR